jgi:hypothetical protein
VPRGTGRYDNATKDLSQGLVDCASGVEDLVNILDGRSTAGGSLWTGNASSVLPQMGFQRGMGGPGDFRIGYNSGHMQATLPGGTPVNYGSTEAIQAGGVSGSLGADDPSFTDHWFRPAGASAGMAPGGAPSLGGGGGVVPVYVTNMGGMGAGGAAPGGAGAPPASGGGNAWGAASPAATAGLNWDALAQKEASGDWGNTSNPKYRGGLQFDIPTWNQFKPAGAPGDPAAASKEMQIAAAQNALNSGRTPQSLWPQNYGQLGTGGGAPGAPGGTGIPAPAGASPAVADILSRMNPITGAGGGGNIPLAPGGGQGPILPAYQPGIGAGLGQPIPGSPDAPLPLGGVGPDTTRIGGLAPAESINPGGAGFGIMPGGTIDSLIQGGLQAAGSAGGMFGGGAGGAAASAAAQTLMKLANRAIQFGGQAAGIGVQGLMDTFLPTGGSELAQNNWFTRIAGAVGAAAPALPNLAGGALGQAQQQGPLTPEQVAANGNQHGMANGAAPGPPQINITQNNEHTGPLPAEQSAAAIGDNMRTAAQAPSLGMGLGR